ncbi:hypothetical protein GCM10027425_08480 [Alteromonas gracilis]
MTSRTPRSPLRSLPRTLAVHMTTTLALGAGLLLGTAGLAEGPGRDVAPARVEAEAPRVDATDLEPVARKRMRGVRWPGHPDRRLVRYRVRSGDTPSSIAVRFHAWTAELIRINRRSGVFYAGEVIRVPVVISAARRHGHRVGVPHGSRTTKARAPRQRADRPAPRRAPQRASRHRAGQVYSKATVRRVVVRTARRYDVNPNLALAIAWQESGWQTGRSVVSSAGALGPMQVMPDTGEWMSMYAGRRLDLQKLHDNVIAGISLIRVLRSQFGIKNAIAAYYQGAGAVERYGWYDDTKQYVANVVYLRNRFADGWNPLR